MSIEIARCGSCDEPIYWLKHPITNKPAPIEVATSENGNIVVNLTRGDYDLVRAEERHIHKGFLHLNHFATCPAAKAWAKGGNRNATSATRDERATKDERAGP